MDRRQQEIGVALDDYAAGALNRRGFLRRVGLVGVSVVAAGTLLDACSSGSTNSGPATDPTAAGGKPVKGGTLREGYDHDFTPPDSVNNAWADPSFYALFEPVITRDPNGNMVPMLASAFTSGANGWTFEIPSGLTFQSGAPLGARQVADFFNVARDPKLGANASFWEPIKSVSTKGNQVVCGTAAPFKAFQETVCTEYSMISNVRARKKAGDKWGSEVMDGTGPFTLSKFVPGRSVLVKRWEKYPGCHAPFVVNKGPAYLDSIEWVPITEGSQRAPEIETGNVDAIKNPPPQDVARLKENSDLVVQEFQELSNFFLQLNMGETDLGFDDVRVRQAISVAIDREAIVKNILLGHGVATYGPVMPGNRWYSAEVEAYNKFDSAKASSLLDEAGWAKGSDGIRVKNGNRMSFTVLHQTDTTENQVLQAIIQMLAAVGVEMKLDNQSSASFWGALNDKVPVYSTKWLWSSPIDCVQYFVGVFQPKKAQTPQMTSLYEAYQRAATEDQMKIAAAAYQRYYAENLPLIPIYTPNTIWVHQKKVVGWQPNQANLYPYYNDVWLTA